MKPLRVEMIQYNTVNMSPLSVSHSITNTNMKTVTHKER